MANFVYCSLCGGEYNALSGEHICEIADLKLIIQEGQEFGDLSPKRKAELEERIAQVEEWEAAGRGHIRVARNFPMSHGGARPNSGPLAGRVSFRPFAHTEKGRTHSAVTIRFQRCNTCGARGLEVVEAESLYDYDAPTDGGFSGPQPESISNEPLTHKPGCEFGPA